MFNKTKRKIVFTVVLSLLVLMAVTLTTIYISNRIVIRNENEELLKTYAEQYKLENMPEEQESDKRREPKLDDRLDTGEPPVKKEHMRDEPRFRLSTFYSVAYSNSGEVLAVRNGNSELQSEDSILSLADSIIKSGKTNGSKGNIYYLVSDKKAYTLVSMMDGTISDSNQETLIKEMTVIGSAAMVILFIISIFIARRIISPLEENDRRQKLFVSDAGHELKTPIAVISANSELLKRELGENEWLSNIDYENQRMSELVKQLLLLSRAENGEMPRENVDFSKLADGECLVIESLAFEKGKRIETEIEQGITIDGNPGQLRQLVSILLDNALSHGTGEEIRLTLHREKHSAVLTVSNGAPELASEQLDHLFDRFYRTDEARGDSGSHYGLGLSIAKAVVEAHAGKINASYSDGKIKFTVFLDVKKN